MEKTIYTICVMNSEAKLETVFATVENLHETVTMLEERGFPVLTVTKRVN